MQRLALTLALPLLLTACDSEHVPDGGSCPVGVHVGTVDTGTFVGLGDGDPVELLLGFQGFRMLRLGVRATGAAPRDVEIGAYLSVADTGVEVSQHTRERELTPQDGGFLLEEYLLFFNDQPPALLVGYAANLELTVRAAGCVGGTSVAVQIRDDDPCIDHGIVIDAATRPDAPDGGTSCD